MRIIDRIAISRILSMILSFIIQIIELFVKEPQGDKKPRKKIFPNLRKKS